MVGCDVVTTGTGTPGATVPAPSPSVQRTAPSASPSAPPIPSASGSTSSGVAVDLSLLDHLPSTVDGLPVEADAETSASVAASPGLASDASAIAIARVVAAASDDLAVASIVRLRSGPLDAASYGRWRTTYDEAACAPAGGVAATTQRVVDGRTVFATACNGGAQTYHVALGDDILVSITAIGGRQLGDLLVAGLRE